MKLFEQQGPVQQGQHVAVARHVLVDVVERLLPALSVRQQLRQDFLVQDAGHARVVEDPVHLRLFLALEPRRVRGFVGEQFGFWPVVLLLALPARLQAHRGLPVGVLLGEDGAGFGDLSPRGELDGLRQLNSLLQEFRRLRQSPGLIRFGGFFLEYF